MTCHSPEHEPQRLHPPFRIPAIKPGYQLAGEIRETELFSERIDQSIAAERKQEESDQTIKNIAVTASVSKTFRGERFPPALHLSH